MLSAKEVGVYLIQVVAFARSVVLYAVQVVPSVVFSQVPFAAAVVVSVNSIPPVLASYNVILSAGTVPPNAVANHQAKILLAGDDLPMEIA